MRLRRSIIAVTALAVAFTIAGARADAQVVQECARYPIAAVAGIDAEAAAPLACEGSFTCPAGGESCEVFLFGRLWGIGAIELTHTGTGETCERRGSQAHCTTGGTLQIEPGASEVWTCAAGLATTAVRIELECSASWLNA